MRALDRTQLVEQLESARDWQHQVDDVHIRFEGFEHAEAGEPIRGGADANRSFSAPWQRSCARAVIVLDQHLGGVGKVQCGHG